MSNQGLSSEDFRQVMGNHAAGVVVVSTTWGGVNHGVTVNSMTSVSLNPAIVLICLNHNSQTAAAIRARGLFCLNLLGENQELISRQFVRKDIDRFAGVPLHEHADGLPLIDGAAGHLVCKLKTINSVGDHYVVYGDVTECRRQSSRPLLYHKGQYCRLAI
jgi:3-hydroxy-9,10-secoandrosta-1,3,5(10)-triene-9,17-dione monooxygenase reductase component